MTMVAAICLPALAKAVRPNIIVIQTDDQNARSVKADFRDSEGKLTRVMPNTVRGIFDKGTEFRNYYATSPVCSPSRASLLTGQYPHNNNLIANSGTEGGWLGYKSRPLFRHNAPLALERSGYRTSHFGKLINGYYDSENDQIETVVPPGWSNWFTTSFLPGAKYYGYEVNDNGGAVGPFGDGDYQSRGSGIDSKNCTAKLLVRRQMPDGFQCNYLTDLMTRGAVEEIRRRHDRPFFMQIDYQAPHLDRVNPEGPQPASRHLDSADRMSLPRPSNFNESDVSDKPLFLRAGMGEPLDETTVNQLRRSSRREIESLRAVDDGVGAIISTLKETKQLNNTYIFYLSDHGYFQGAHRFGLGKFLAYEEGSSVAMAVRGPDVESGATSHEVVGNIDIPATALRLAGAKPNYRVDGRSLEPYWSDSGLRSRRPLEISLGSLGNGKAKVPTVLNQLATWVRLSLKADAKPGKAPSLRYRGYRVGPYKYIDYEQGGFELYDLSRDPRELRNAVDDPAYSKVVRYMRRHLPEVANCQGSQCRKSLPPWPTPR